MITEIEEVPVTMIGDYKLQFDLGEPSERTKEVALRELRETPENIKNGLEELKRLLDGKFYKNNLILSYQKIDISDDFRNFHKIFKDF